MAELQWKDAITQVLREKGEAMHYTEIADSIASQELRKALGATPALTVNGVITTSINNEGVDSPFLRVKVGFYALRSDKETGVKQQHIEVDIQKVTGLINAFGMFWLRENVIWTSPPKIPGRQKQKSSRIDFANQSGVYILYDTRSVIYVGKTTEQRLGQRLYEHTIDRLSGRWNRFSWFGIYPVDDKASLVISEPDDLNMDTLISTMEAILIEGLEPPQNRKRGEDFNAVEFQQVVDEELQKDRLLKDLTKIIK